VDVYDDLTGEILGKHSESYTILDVPYYPQGDNKCRPRQTCNMTSAAMVVEFFHPGKDAMTEYCVGFWGHDSIYYHDKIVKVLNHWKVKSDFSTQTSFSRIKQHLAQGNPVIYSGRFTSSGHIIVLRGYDSTGFWVNDPNGEWFSWGYKRYPHSGERLHYSYNMMGNLSYSGTHAGWAHLCEKM
jgi:uncharacterized protein YvpB